MSERSGQIADVLAGIRVLDFGRYIAGPYCAALLADLGADVIRVERRGGGEDRWVAPVGADGVGAMYLVMNRNKRAMTLDPACPEGRDIVRKLVGTADVEVLYELFQTRDEMNEAFQVNVNNKAAPEGECASDHLAVGSYTFEGEPAGRVLCYTVGLSPSAQSRIEWTDENASIYAQAVRNDQGDVQDDPERLRMRPLRGDLREARQG